MSSTIPTAAAEDGVHLVGSIPLADAASVFRKCSEDLPQRLRRIPDGETGIRGYFVYFQLQHLSAVPEIMVPFEQLCIQETEPTGDKVEPRQDVLARMPKKVDTGYDRFALESYATFKHIRDVEKLLPPDTRFQVCLPTSTNITCMIKPEYRAAVDALFRPAILEACKKIQLLIPKNDLAIQIDMAADFAYMEGVLYPWYAVDEQHGAFPELLQHAVTLASSVEPEVELGFHLCYGDIGHKHFIQPKDAGFLTQAAVALLSNVERNIDWIHLPVPKDRDDIAYFAPLAELEAAKVAKGGNTALYLGLVHSNDLEGTQRRITSARKVVSTGFGIASECGLGRASLDEMESIFSISRDMSAPTNKAVYDLGHDAAEKTLVVAAEPVKIADGSSSPTNG